MIPIEKFVSLAKTRLGCMIFSRKYDLTLREVFDLHSQKKIDCGKEATLNSRLSLCISL